MAASSIRFGPGCTKEVGMDFKNMGAKRVCVVTDTNVAKLDAMRQVVEALDREGVSYTIYDQVRVEPKDSSYDRPPAPIELFVTERRTEYETQLTLQNRTSLTHS